MTCELLLGTYAFWFGAIFVEKGEQRDKRFCSDPSVLYQYCCKRNTIKIRLIHVIWLYFEVAF